ncbi:hypothetical protein BCR32DRAFT_268073 [Anaeromyces robustus]|uniref:SWIRM domain-containing protein n=1 Tax=Anaeromyces robustus TaxID=1754192 RepID=A0A1Y1X7T5_9FUNG|nr:hypothetical protein BCR32DRAFT_268073 [Anaeromyces robustus]|eukprot:ORX81778.1 hypothetical protein BCR32DRAFT_268073 [Anaeromyces robustus]
MSSSTPSSSPTIKKEIYQDNNKNSNFLNTPNITPKQYGENNSSVEINKNITSEGLLKSFENKKENDIDKDKIDVYSTPNISPPLNKNEKSLSNHPPILISHAKNLFSTTKSNLITDNFDNNISSQNLNDNINTKTFDNDTNIDNNIKSIDNSIHCNNKIDIQKENSYIIFNNKPKEKNISFETNTNINTNTPSTYDKVDIDNNRMNIENNNYNNNDNNNDNINENNQMDIEINNDNKNNSNIVNTIPLSTTPTPTPTPIPTTTATTTSTTISNKNSNTVESTNNNILHKKWNPKMVHRKRKSSKPIRSIDTSNCMSETEKCIEGIVKIEIYPIIKTHPTYLIDTPKEAEHLSIESPLKIVQSRRQKLHNHFQFHRSNSPSFSSNSFTYTPRLNSPPPKTYPISRLVRQAYHLHNNDNSSTATTTTKKSHKTTRQYHFIGNKSEFPEDSDTYKKMKYINPPTPMIWKKGVPLEITPETPMYDLLNKEEIETCSLLRILPSQYLRIRHILLKGYRKNGYYLKKDAKKWCHGVDVNKTAKLYDWWVDIGWLPFKDIILEELKEKEMKRLQRKKK